MAVDLGARVVNEVQDATHLVTCLPFKRTMKLLSAIVHLRPIIDVAWLRDSHKSKSKNLLSFEKYALKDRKVEREFGFTLAETQRLWEEKRNVFEGKSFYVTRRTRPSPSDLKTLITAGGGKVLGTVVAARAERPRESCFVISCALQLILIRFLTFTLLLQVKKTPMNSRRCLRMGFVFVPVSSFFDRCSNIDSILMSASFPLELDQLFFYS